MAFHRLARALKTRGSSAQFLRHKACRLHSSLSNKQNEQNEHDEQDEQEQARYEPILARVESEELYGLPKQDRSIGDLGSTYQKGKLNLFPEYQRDYVWGKNDSKHSRASRLVVTVLCSRFIPPVVLHERKKGHYDVVDGKQRLSSLLAFYYGESPTVTSPVPTFTQLGGLKEEYEELNGLKFSSLTKSRQDAFENYSLTIMKLNPKTPSADVFDVYQDINSGGTSLTAQQIRRAAFFGDYIKKLDELAKNDVFLEVVGASQPDLSEAHQELILRALAFQSFKDFKPPLKRFLNEELAKSAKLDEKVRNRQLSQAGAQFIQVMKVAKEIFTSTRAFRTDKKNIDKALWDVKYCALRSVLFDHKTSATRLQQRADLINESFSDLLSHETFVKNLKSRNVASFESCYEMIKHCLLGSFQDNQGQRFFKLLPKEMKELYDKQQGKCGLCGTELKLDDAAVDHIIPWAKGGRTVISNAQLAHTRCNSSKGARYQKIYK